MRTCDILSVRLALYQLLFPVLIFNEANQQISLRRVEFKVRWYVHNIRELLPEDLMLLEGGSRILIVRSRPGHTV